MTKSIYKKTKRKTKKYKTNNTHKTINTKTKVQTILKQTIPKIIYNTQFLVKQEKAAAKKQGKGFGAKSIKEEVDSCISFLSNKPKIFIDVGAHKGMYTKEVLRQIPDLECYLFEPSPANTEILKTAFSNLHNVNISTNALSNITGKQKIYFPTPGSELTSLTHRRLDHFHMYMDYSEEIETTRFDDFWEIRNSQKKEKEKLNDKNVDTKNNIIDYVKIDVEGHELNVLEGFGKLINNIGLIQFEFGGANIDTKTYFQDFWYYFKDKDFTLYRIAPDGVIPIKNYIELDEFFDTTNYIAVNNKINPLKNITTITKNIEKKLSNKIKDTIDNTIEKTIEKISRLKSSSSSHSLSPLYVDPISPFTARIICNTSHGYTFDDAKYIEKLLTKIGGTVTFVLWKKRSDINAIYPDVDIQVFMEHLYLDYPQLLFPAKHTYIIANYLYLTLWDQSRLRDKSITALCKSQEGVIALKNSGINSEFIGFGKSINRKFTSNNIKGVENKIPSTVLHNVEDIYLQGTRELIEAWRAYVDKSNKKFMFIPCLIIIIDDTNNVNTILTQKSNPNLFTYWQSLNPKKQYLPNHLTKKLPQNVKIPQFEVVGSIYLYREKLNIQVMDYLKTICMAYACPSKIESWSQTIDEGRRLGSIVLTLDAPPMNTLVDTYSGIIIPATQGENLQSLIPSNMKNEYASLSSSSSSLSSLSSLSLPTYKTTIQQLGGALQQLLFMKLEMRKQKAETAYNKALEDTNIFINLLRDLFNLHLLNKPIDLTYFSQLGQDKWVDTILKKKEDGYFVEVGASDGLYHSNSLFFERLRHWKGICIDANPKLYKDLEKYRTCNVSNAFISTTDSDNDNDNNDKTIDNDDKTIDFADCGLLSAGIETAGPMTTCNEIIKVKAKTLYSILKKYKAPKIIDYLSIDVEGHEFYVLMNFPFNEYTFKCITVDHNEVNIGPQLRKQIRTLLEANSYIYVKSNDGGQGISSGMGIGMGNESVEDFYIHSSIKK